MSNKKQALAYLSLGVILDRLFISNKKLYFLVGLGIGLLINGKLWSMILSLFN